MGCSRTRAFICAPADLETPSATPPPTPNSYCKYVVSPNIQPVNLKTHYSFNSRPTFIPVPPEPQPSRPELHLPPATVQPVPPRNSSPVLSHIESRESFVLWKHHERPANAYLVLEMDILPESEHHASFRDLASQLRRFPSPLFERELFFSQGYSQYKLMVSSCRHLRLCILAYRPL